MGHWCVQGAGRAKSCHCNLIRMARCCILHVSWNKLEPLARPLLGCNDVQSVVRSIF